MFPLYSFLGILLVLLLDILLFKVVKRYAPQQRKYLLPFLISSLLWPIMQNFWQLEVGNRGWPAAHGQGYLVRHSLWYTFDTHQPLAGFIYRHWEGAIPWSGVLALVDVLILGALLCLPVYFLVLIRRSWWFE
jgi:hypothetical protein